MREFVPRAVKLRVKRMSRSVIESVRYRVSRGAALRSGGRHVVFVCKGNICRSAFAERYCRDRFDGRLTIESGGLDAREGALPPPEAVKAAGRLGVDLGRHRSRGLDAGAIDRADLILPMEYWQYRKLIALFPHKRINIRLLREFIPGPSGWVCNIDDPYGLPSEDYDDCFRLMIKALDRLESRLGVDHE